MSSNRKGDIKKWGFYLIFISAILYLLAIILDNTKYPLIVDILKFLSAAFLTTGLFSIIIGLSDFVNYVTNRLKAIIVEHSYLTTLSQTEREKLKKDIDSIIFGEGVIKNPDSLYCFIEERMSSLYKSPFRTEFHDIYYFTNSEIDDYWIEENHTSYTLHCDLENKINALIVFENKTIITDKTKPFNFYLKEINLKIKDDAFNLTYTPDSKTIIKAHEGNQYIKHDVDLDINYDDTEDTMNVNFGVKVPHSMFEDVNSVSVSIKSISLFHKKDNIVYLNVVYPTKDLLLSCEFKDGNNLTNCQAFGIDPIRVVKKDGINSAFVDIKEWLLPGHGAAIAWLPIDK